MNASTPPDRAALASLVDRAVAMTAARLATAPGWNVLQSIDAQLRHIQGDVRSGGVPTDDVRRRINIGLYAVREFEASDPEYAEVLMEIAYAYDRLR